MHSSKNKILHYGEVFFKKQYLLTVSVDLSSSLNPQHVIRLVKERFWKDGTETERHSRVFVCYLVFVFKLGPRQPGLVGWFLRNFCSRDPLVFQAWTI